jgi:hypothetical protein
MTPTLRPFRYAYRALMARQQWSLERRQRELAEAMVQRDKAHQALEALRRQVEHVQAALGASRAVLDPAWRRSSLSFLGHLEGQASRLEAECRRTDIHCDDLRRACLDEHQRLEAFEQHRQRCRHAHERAMAQALAARIDDDWSARAAAQAAPCLLSPATMDAGSPLPREEPR